MLVGALLALTLTACSGALASQAAGLVREGYDIAKDAPSSTEAAGGTGEAPAQIGGDVIVSIDGQDVIGFDDLLSYVTAAEVGQRVTLGVLRDGEMMTLNVMLAARPHETQ